MYIVYSGVYMYSYMYIKKKKKKKKKKKIRPCSLSCVARRWGTILILNSPSSLPRELVSYKTKEGGGGGGGERLYLSRVVRNPSRVISSGFTGYICRS